MAKTQTSKEMDMVRDVIGLIGVIVMVIWTLTAYGYFDVTTYVAIQYFALIGAGAIVVWGVLEMMTVGEYDGIFNILALGITVSAGILAWLGWYDLGVSNTHVLITTVGATGWFIGEVIRD